jgi:hypothetical protein
MDQQTTQSSPSRTVTMVLRECGICQSSIYPTETTTTCKSCGLTFHNECWQENLGCAAYGCEQVDALKPKSNEPPPEPLPAPVAQPIEALPWTFLLLGASALSLAVSSLTYGIPSAFTALLIAWRMWQKRAFRDTILITAAVIAVVGMAGGVLVSRFWWLRE